MTGIRFIVFDWDGTAVTTREPDAAAGLVAPLERVIEQGALVYIVTGTKHDWAANQLRNLRPDLASRVAICCNRGSEVYRLGHPPTLVLRRDMSEAENAALAACGEAVIEPLVAAGHTVRIISDRLNRIKVDLLPDWDDPPKSEIDEVMRLVNSRFAEFGGLTELLKRAAEIAESSPVDFKVTSDAKHIEIGITDKSHSMEWVMNDVFTHGGSAADVVIVGDEFGSIGGFDGSDSKTAVAGAAVYSVGLEPNGVPDGVEHIGGGPAAFANLLASIGAA